jgi:hypothetical protein
MDVLEDILGPARPRIPGARAPDAAKELAKSAKDLKKERRAVPGQAPVTVVKRSSLVGRKRARADEDEAPSSRRLTGRTPEELCAAGVAALRKLPALSDADEEAADARSHLVADIAAEALKEHNLVPLRNAAGTLGLAAIVTLLQRTGERERGDGMLTADGKRRRTAGGVFYALLKEVTSKEEYKAIFVEKAEAHTNTRNRMKRRLADEVLVASGILEAVSGIQVAEEAGAAARPSAASSYAPALASSLPPVVGPWGAGMSAVFAVGR